MIDQTEVLIAIASAVIANIVTMAVGIAVLKNDMRWFRHWCTEHEASDNHRHIEMTVERQQMRDSAVSQTLAMSQRLAALEANQHIEQVILGALKHG